MEPEDHAVFGFVFHARFEFFEEFVDVFVDFGVELLSFAFRL